MKLTGVMASALLLLSGTCLAIEADHFRVRNTLDLVTLCAVDPQHPDAREALGFCHGFGEGAWRYHRTTLNSPDDEFVCMPDPLPMRSGVIRKFIKWIDANPKYLSEPAIDTMFRFLEITYPCKK